MFQRPARGSGHPDESRRRTGGGARASACPCLLLAAPAFLTHRHSDQHLVFWLLLPSWPFGAKCGWFGDLRGSSQPTPSAGWPLSYMASPRASGSPAAQGAARACLQEVGFFNLKNQRLWTGYGQKDLEGAEQGVRRLGKGVRAGLSHSPFPGKLPSSLARTFML